MFDFDGVVRYILFSTYRVLQILPFPSSSWFFFVRDFLFYHNQRTLIFACIRMPVLWAFRRIFYTQVYVQAQIELWSDYADWNDLWSDFQDRNYLWSDLSDKNDLWSDFPDQNVLWSDRTQTTV